MLIRLARMASSAAEEDVGLIKQCTAVLAFLYVVAKQTNAAPLSLLTLRVLTTRIALIAKSLNDEHFNETSPFLR